LVTPSTVVLDHGRSPEMGAIPGATSHAIARRRQGIKSPSPLQARNCKKRQMPAPGPFRLCNDLHRTAVLGDEAVRACVRARRAVSRALCSCNSFGGRGAFGMAVEQGVLCGLRRTHAAPWSSPWPSAPLHDRGLPVSPAQARTSGSRHRMSQSASATVLGRTSIGAPDLMTTRQGTDRRHMTSCAASDGWSASRAQMADRETSRPLAVSADRGGRNDVGVG
jgi:hypothetical protein